MGWATEGFVTYLLFAKEGEGGCHVTFLTSQHQSMSSHVPLKLHKSQTNTLDLDRFRRFERHF